MKRVLFVTSQMYPFVTGTMGIFNYSLPKGLKELGIDARVIVPKFKEKRNLDTVASFKVDLHHHERQCNVEFIDVDGIPVYVVDEKELFNRPELYGYPDEAERFIFFAKSVVDFLPHLRDLDGFVPDILHCQDWHTGFVPFFIQSGYSDFALSTKIMTLLTIHNMGYQGIFDKEHLDYAGVAWDDYVSRGLDYYNQINFMKTGVTYANLITTVSPSYAQEIMTEQYGATLEETMKSRADDIVGVLCGLDLTINDPSTDNRLHACYSSDDLSGKELNKEQLQRELGFEVNPTIPVLSLFSRLKTEKGLDLVKAAFHDLMKSNIQFVIVSNGDALYENFFKKQAAIYSGRFAFRLYDNDLAYRAYAGSDIFLMPSSYEPCGIGQLIALRYGTVPVVRQVGGLNDTIKQFNPSDSSGNGFIFKPYNARVMLHAIREAVEAYQNCSSWKELVKNCMRDNHGWSKYVNKYVNVYDKVIEKRELKNG